MFPVGLPLLLIPFAVYNFLALSKPEFAWSHELWHVHMPSGGDWVLTLGDAFVTASVVLLLVALLRFAHRAGRRTIADHVLSMVLFVAMLVEFMSVKAVASSTFFLMLVVSFVDVAAGFTVSIRSAPRDILIDNPGGGRGREGV